MRDTYYTEYFPIFSHALVISIKVIGDVVYKHFQNIPEFKHFPNTVTSQNTSRYKFLGVLNSLSVCAIYSQNFLSFSVFPKTQHFSSSSVVLYVESLFHFRNLVWC